MSIFTTELTVDKLLLVYNAILYQSWVLDYEKVCTNQLNESLHMNVLPMTTMVHISTVL